MLTDYHYKRPLVRTVTDNYLFTRHAEHLGPVWINFKYL